MSIRSTYVNRVIEALDPHYDSARARDLEAMSRAYNYHLGPVTAVNVHRPDLLDPGMYAGSCEHVPIGALIPDLTVKAGVADTLFIPGGGKGVSLSRSLLGSLGEVAERLLGVLHFAAVRDNLQFGSYRDLTKAGFPALSPDELPLFAPEQYAKPEFPYVPFREDTLLQWLPGVDLSTDRTVFVPAQVVLVYYRPNPREAKIAYPTTGGLAFHTDRREAVLHGICECVERDAINVRWYSRLPPRRLDLDTGDVVSGVVERRRVRVTTASIPEIEVFDTTLDVPIPVLTVLAIDRTKTERAFVAGGGAGVSRTEALLQALFEIGQTRNSLKYHRALGLKNIRSGSSVEEMTDFFDATIYYGFEANLGKLDWYRDGARADWDDVADHPAPSAEAAYETVLDLLRTVPARPLVFDFGGACWKGVYVTKVLLPELTQASVPSHPFLGHPRYYELGGRTFSELAVDPVPFP